ncbi:glycosyltransferase family 9 protein [Pleurocapsales cyanobacterium LEGE 06147]|nr:glycosyltransferase family 9 protein [Pleurocapsales cyanobacterium LEGE 06147]
MRILALVPGGIGDQILFFPTLETLKRQYPNAAIDVLVEPRAKAAYRVCKNVDEVLLFDYKDRNSLADYLNLLGIIRDREYDVALSVVNRWTIGLLLWLNGIPVRISYQNNFSWFFTHLVPLKREQYIAQMYHDLVRGLGINLSCPPVRVNLPKEDIDWAEAEQKRLEIKDSGYILIYDNSKQLALGQGIERTYPVAQWQKIVADIEQKQPDLPIVLIQSFDNGDWVARMTETSANLKAIVPPDLGKLSAIIAGANLMLCTDSVPMHLSVAVETYTIALFGPTDAKKLLPSESESYIGIQSTTSKIADIKPETILEQIWRG